MPITLYCDQSVTALCSRICSPKRSARKLWNLWHQVIPSLFTYYFITASLQYKSRLSSYAKRVCFLATAFASVLRNTQTHFELFWIGLRIRNAFGMNRNCTFRVCLFSQIVICERLVGWVSFKTNVSEYAGQIHLSDNVRCKGHSHLIDNVWCKMHQTRLQVKRTSRLRLIRKLKSVWK